MAFHNSAVNLHIILVMSNQNFREEEKPLLSFILKVFNVAYAAHFSTLSDIVSLAGGEKY